MNDPIIAFLNDNHLVRRAYLGDGVYCGIDPADQVWLVTERGARSPSGAAYIHYVALEPAVQVALTAYLSNRGQKAAPPITTPEEDD